MSPRSYTIKKGSTPDVLADFYNTNQSTLNQLNSDQIKDLNSLYDGKTIIVPPVQDVSGLSRISPQEALSKELLVQSDCASINYTEIIFIPEHPESKKPEWLALTEDAVNEIEAESNECLNAVKVGDKAGTVEGLIQLGVLSGFSHPVHESFLSDSDKALYRKYLYEYSALKAAVAKNVIWVPEDYQDELNAIGVPQSIQTIIESHVAAGDFNSYEVELGKAAMKSNKCFSLMGDLIKSINKYIKILEDTAQRKATNTTFVEGSKEYKFAYHNEGKYYTSDHHLKVLKALNALVSSREGIYKNTGIDKDSVTATTEIVSVTKMEEHYKKVCGFIRSIQNLKYKDAHQVRAFLTTSKKESGSTRGMVVNLFTLNHCGYAIKEQCLTPSDLYDGAEVIDKIDLTPAVLDRNSTDIDKLGYYSCEALILKLSKEIFIRIKDFESLIGETVQAQSYVSRLLTISLNTQARMDELKRKAENRLQQNNSLQYFFSPTGNTAYSVGLSKAITLLWDERQWKPRNTNNLIYNTPGENSLQIVECFLGGNNGKACYVRSNCNAISLNQNNNCRHNKRLGEVKVPPPAIEGYQSKEIAKALLEPDVELKTLSKQFVNLSDAISQKNWFSWRAISGNNVPKFLPTVAMEFGAQTQFFRFASSLDLSDNRNLQADTDGKFKLAKLESKTPLDIIQGSAKFEVDVPKDKRGTPFTIDYVVYKNGSEEIKAFDAGAYRASLVVTVRGLVGVSCVLGSEIYIGTVETDATKGAGIGLKGMVPQVTEYNNYKKSNTTLEAGLSAGIKTEAKLFAGIEIGGDVTVKFDWRPPEIGHTSMGISRPRTDSFQTLVEGRAAVNAAAGFSGELVFQLSFQNGKFVYIMAAKAVFGGGLGGKVAMAISPFAFDQLFDVLLSITKKEGFRRVVFFKTTDSSGEKDETFARLNQMLTIMITYQLEAAQVLMLPFKVLDELERKARVEKNAPIIARYINSADPESRAVNKLPPQKAQALRSKIEKMYPETLASMLYVLSHHQTASMWDEAAYQLSRLGGEDEFDNNNDDLSPTKKAIMANARQRKAILNILKWISVNASKPTEADKRQFEEALQRMHLKPNEQLDKSKQWDCYWSGLKRLHNEFFYRHYKQYYDSRDDVLSANRDYIKFIENISKLGGRIHIYQDAVKISKEGYIMTPVIIQKAFLTGEGTAPIESRLKQAGFSNKATRIGWTYTGKVS